MIQNILFLALLQLFQPANTESWVRINQLGYKTDGLINAIWCSKNNDSISEFRLVEVITGKSVFKSKAVKNFGSYGPFTRTCRLDFSNYSIEGRYVIQAGGTTSPEFTISSSVYKGSSDFCLKYMRQQRSGFNPYLNDSCHTHDGYALYGAGAGLPDSTHVDVSGGWHDASDYLQYTTTSANAVYLMLMAWRDFPGVFEDSHKANGLKGRNGKADVLDEAKWGLDWLLKMHPNPNWMFTQLGDDRDHASMRIPKEDSFYGKGFERAVYFNSGLPQQRGKFMNSTKGTSSVAGRFSSAFMLGSKIFQKIDSNYSKLLLEKGTSAVRFGEKIKGSTQTASVKAPYIYAEENWFDDMELAYANFDGYYNDRVALQLSLMESVTGWILYDTANHYQYYPFVNIGNYELAKKLKNPQRQRVVEVYKFGIEKVWERSKGNAFYRGVPFIWCSNNLTTAFALQCYWYRQLSGDNSFIELEQACFDWLFGVNPWGTSMVYGLPAWGDTPSDPHSAFTHLKNYPIDGGLIDGPVKSSIFSNLIGISLTKPDEYASFQSSLAVYHDDYGDYSTNEPTMDGTAFLIYLLAAKDSEKLKSKK
jgi:hypothetical protein